MLYRTLLLFFLSLACTSAVSVAQIVTEIALPKGYSCEGWPAIYKGRLYLQMRSAEGRGHLWEYDSGVEGKLIDNPDSSTPGYAGYPVVMQDTLFIVYNDSLDHSHLARFDGHLLQRISNPLKSRRMTPISDDPPLAVGNSIYFFFLGDSTYGMGCYNNGRIRLIPMKYPAYYVIYRLPFAYHHHLYLPLYYERPYLPYHHEFPGNGPAKFDGNEFTPLPGPDKTTEGYDGAAVEYNNLLYFSYLNEKKERQLANCDGATIRLVTNPNGVTYSQYNSDWGPVVFQNKLCVLYAGSTRDPFHTSILGVCDGSKLRLIPSPPEAQIVHTARPIVFRNKLYFQVERKGRKGLGEFDGDRIRLIVPPGDTVGAYGGNAIVYKDKLYFDLGFSLGVFDGTKVTRIWTGPAQLAYVTPIPLIVYYNRLFFLALGRLYILSSTN